MASGKYTISVSKLAKDDIASLRVFDQRQIIDAMEEHLASQPTKESKSRIKKMTQPFWSEYRLRVGEFRVYYDVDAEANEVLILRVCEKGQEQTPKDLTDETD